MSKKRLVPKRRFKGFTDDWEQRKLGEVAEITMGQSPDGSTYSGVPSGNILIQGNADLQDGWVIPRVWTTQVTKKLSLHFQNLLFRSAPQYKGRNQAFWGNKLLSSFSINSYPAPTHRRTHRLVT
jgi:restriction endonuclease S subunit